MTQVPDKNKKKIYLVILNYNGLEWLDRFFKTLNATLPKSVSLIFVDNASTDGSLERVKDLYPGLRIITNERNLGYAGGMNKGILTALAEGAEYIGLLNVDLWFEEGWLEGLIGALKNPCVGIAGPYQLEYDNNQPNEWTKEMVGLAPEEKTVEVSWVEGSCILLKKDVFLKTGLFYEGFFMYYEEIHLCRMASFLGYRSVIVPGSRVHHKRGAPYRENMLIRSQYIYNLLDPSRSFSRNLYLTVRTFAQHVKSAMLEKRLSKALFAGAGLLEVLTRLPEYYRQWQNDRNRILGEIKEDHLK